MTMGEGVYLKMKAVLPRGWKRWGAAERGWDRLLPLPRSRSSGLHFRSLRPFFLFVRRVCLALPAFVSPADRYCVCLLADSGSHYLCLVAILFLSKLV